MILSPDLLFALFGFFLTALFFGVIGLLWWLRDQRNPWILWWSPDQPQISFQKAKWDEGELVVKPPGESKKRRITVTGIQPRRVQSWRPGDTYLVDPKTLNAMQITYKPSEPFLDSEQVAQEGPNWLLEPIDGRVRNEMADFDLGRNLDKGAQENALAEFLRRAPVLVVLALGLIGFTVWMIYGG